MTHLAFELRTSTPEALIPALAAAAEGRGGRLPARAHPGRDRGRGPGPADAPGVGAAQLTELTESAPFRRQLPAYAARFRRSGIGPEQASIAASQLSDLSRLLERWRETVGEVVLVPVRADEAGPARDLVAAAIAAF